VILPPERPVSRLVPVSGLFLENLSMRKLIALCALGLILSGLQSVNAGDLESGLKPGEYPKAFYLTDITGPAANTKLCYRCQYGARSVVSLFVRKMDEKTVKLIKELDTVVAKNSDKKMAAFVTVLTSDPDAQEASLKKIADEQKIGATPMGLYENISGPASYKIASNADVTIMMWVDSNVKVNHAFEAGKLTDEMIAKVIKDTAQILN
jgi:hypothetical protein